MTVPALVRLSDLGHDIGGRAVFAGLDVQLNGGIVTVLGPNGTGKTTLLRCLATVLAPTAGTTSVDGLNPARESERIEIRRRLGYLPQAVSFDPRATVFDIVDHAAVLREVTDDRRRRHAVISSLERIGLRDRLAERCGMLSGGMQRRLALAIALLGAPTLLVLDEPSAGFDPEERQRLREILSERREASTIVVSTHLTDEAALGDRILVLHDGRLAFDGSPRALASKANGRAWVTDQLPPPDVRASWRQADGRHRCLGTPPAGAMTVEPTLEDGYLLVTGATSR